MCIALSKYSTLNKRLVYKGEPGRESVIDQLILSLIFFSTYKVKLVQLKKLFKIEIGEEFPLAACANETYVGV